MLASPWLLALGGKGPMVSIVAPLTALLIGPLALCVAAFTAGSIGALTWVWHRIRWIRATLPKSDAEVAEARIEADLREAFICRPPFGRPGLAVLHADRLELIRIIGARIIVPLADIASVREVRWLNGGWFLWKRGFVMDLKNGQRVGVAVPEPFARRWRAVLMYGSFPWIPLELPSATLTHETPHIVRQAT